MFDLGIEARDKITGAKGILIGRCEYMFGCTQYGMAPRVAKDGKKPDTDWFDEGRLEVIGRGILPAEVKGKRPGADVNPDHPR
jgi:hypothetical protein